MKYYKDSKDGYYALSDSVMAVAEMIEITQAEHSAANPPQIPTQAEINAQLISQLAENDLKIIRALVENDLPRIAAHKTSQAALRLQLK